MVYSNFVTSIDGVATLGATPSAGSVLSGRNQADRFLMGLLRACSDAVLIGAETLRATPGHQWTPEHIVPDQAANFAEVRKRLRRQPQPRLLVLTTNGDIPLAHPAVVGGATIITTDEGATALGGRLPDSSDVIQIGRTGYVDLKRAIEELRSRAYNVVLTEGGPHVLGELIHQRLLDEAFLTVSPVVAGRNSDPRLGMIAGVELLPEHGVWTRLLSARRHGDFLFLRYDLRSSARP